MRRLAAGIKGPQTSGRGNVASKRESGGKGELFRRKSFANMRRSIDRVLLNAPAAKHTASPWSGPRIRRKTPIPSASARHLRPRDAPFEAGGHGNGHSPLRRENAGFPFSAAGKPGNVEKQGLHKGAIRERKSNRPRQRRHFPENRRRLNVAAPSSGRPFSSAEDPPYPRRSPPFGRTALSRTLTSL
jgi:hypothetical protein